MSSKNYANGLHLIYPTPQHAYLEFSQETEGANTYRTLRAALENGTLPGISDISRGDKTILISCLPDHTIPKLQLENLLASLPKETTQLKTTPPSQATTQTLTITVRYNGLDVEKIAELTEKTVPELIDWHTTLTWYVKFLGFSPGFGYLVPWSEPSLVIPRLTSPRPTVPAGAVALAGPYSAIYPRRSPGGWHIIGYTQQNLWDSNQQPPTPLQPGRFIRFQPE